MATPLKTLISKLNDTCRRSAERAAAICMARGHHEVEIEHLLLALLEQPRSDLVLLCKRHGVSVDLLGRDLEEEVNRFRQGNTRTPVFSAQLPVLLEQAWLVASLEPAPQRIRSAHLLLALLTDPQLSQLAHRTSARFAGFKLDELKHRLDETTQGSEEARLPGVPDMASGSSPSSEAAEPQSKPGATPALDQYTTPLTQRARQGLLDPVIGRDLEIRQAIDILMRRRQNNPILTGEAGVGKTAVVEGLALRIASGDVPPALQEVELHVLDMGLLQAGSSVKGEFENRLKNVIDEVKKSPHPIVLFIDEAHTMIGAGGQAGQNDAANLLKPALARGELRTVAATTWSEYKKYFEKDAALARRFQVVKVEEPSEALAAAMMRGMAPLMEKHFSVRILDEAITEAVRLSARYISGRQLPDKCISVLDTACAKVALGQSSLPAALEDCVRHLERIQTEMAALQRESAAGSGHAARLAELQAALDTGLQERLRLAERHEAEKALVADIRALTAQVESAGVASAGKAEAEASSAAEEAAVRKRTARRVDAPSRSTLSPAQEALSCKKAELVRLQGEAPLVPLQVDAHVVAQVVSSWTGIPLGRMVKDEIRTVLQLRPLMEERVIGQPQALEAVAQQVRTSRAQLEDPHKPKGVFLFVGPSGVGKTETALALAEVLYGGEKKLITLNMSEYQEAHSVSGLKGSPPGYVGYGEGGVLTEAVRRNPYSVVLLDEVEKAHPDVLELFFQVFDKGVMDDAEGREVDFRNSVIILTSNVGSREIMQSCLNKPVDALPTPEELTLAIRPALYKAFKPAFLGRLKVVPFYALADEVLERVIRLKLKRIATRVLAQHRVPFEYDGKVVEAVLARCTEVDSGARNVDHILNGTLLPEMAQSVLERMAEGRSLQRIKVSVAKNGEFRYLVS